MSCSNIPTHRWLVHVSLHSKKSAFLLPMYNLNPNFSYNKAYLCLYSSTSVTTRPARKSKKRWRTCLTRSAAPSWSPLTGTASCAERDCSLWTLCSGNTALFGMRHDRGCITFTIYLAPSSNSFYEVRCDIALHTLCVLSYSIARSLEDIIMKVTKMVI